MTRLGRYSLRSLQTGYLQLGFVAGSLLTALGHTVLYIFADLQCSAYNVSRVTKKCWSGREKRKESEAGRFSERSLTLFQIDELRFNS